MTGGNSTGQSDAISSRAKGRDVSRATKKSNRGESQKTYMKQTMMICAEMTLRKMVIG